MPPPAARPVGYASRMDRQRRDELVARYRAGAAEVDAAIAGATDAELDAVPPDGGWTARMVVHHLADSEANSYVRVRTLVAEDAPTIQGYDEAEFARRLHYDRPVEASLAVFRAVRASTSDLLGRLGDEDWDRAGTHTESGAYSVDDWLEIYAAHAFDHADQIRRARTSA
jgi:DinB superfamily